MCNCVYIYIYAYSRTTTPQPTQPTLGYLLHRILYHHIPTIHDHAVYHGKRTMPNHITHIHTPYCYVLETPHPPALADGSSEPSMGVQVAESRFGPMGRDEPTEHEVAGAIKLQSCTLPPPFPLTYKPSSCTPFS